ncbi:TIGR04283 family arsenosugar biosynthesis glycosyltransferase [Chloroflexota bacterium]
MNKSTVPFSVIIPTLNEEEIIEKCIFSIRFINKNVEIIIADGHSTDATTRIAEKCGVRVCASEPGRGIQCNTGASIATGDILVFLHADTELPAIAFDQLNKYFQNSKIQIGTFRLSFDNNHWLFRLYSIPSRFECALTRFGDQCIVVRKSFFNSIGGFPSWPLFEDLGFMQKAGKITRIYRFRATVKTSARRFLKHGILRQQLLNIWYIFLYFIGVAPEKLALLYERHNKAK